MPLHPPIEPYGTGVLTTDDGQALYWETCGNPDGRPVLYLHGGPGSGCSAGARRYFDPERYRIVLFDQRGCGRSRPLASDPDVDLERTQTTRLLLDDIERLRELLAIPSWVVKGGSCGSTLALAYAQAHPQRVEALLLAAVATTPEREVRWITEDMRRIFPAAWDRFAEAVPAPLRGTRLVDAYATLLADPGPAVREHAAREWCHWEDVHVSLVPGYRPSRRYEDPAFRLVFARLVTHYWRHAAFLPDGAPLDGATRLAGIPGSMVHGRYDVSGPPDIPWDLHRRWPGSELRIIDDAGHGGAGAFTDAVVDALDRAADLPR